MALLQPLTLAAPLWGVLLCWVFGQSQRESPGAHHLECNTGTKLISDLVPRLTFRVG